MDRSIPQWLSHDVYPFEHRYLDVEGCRVHYVDEGSGPVLLFLHGNPTWSFLYRNIVAGLRSSFRCVALDYPGFGLSDARPGYGFTAAEHADIVHRFVAALDLTEVTMMGQDWGGPIGLGVAGRDPERFSGFVLGNTWAWPLNNIFHFETFARIMGSSIARVAIRRGNAFVNVMIPLGTATTPAKETMEAYRGPFPDPDSRMPTWQFPRELLGSKPFMESLQANLPRIAHLPVLLLWGGKDFALRKKFELPRFQKLFPNHDTVVLPHARHFFQEDAPDDCVREIRAWMNRRLDVPQRTRSS